MISKQGPAAGGVDEDVSRSEHRHRVLRSHDGGGALHPVRAARIDQIAEGALDGVERAEPQHPVAQECTQVRSNRLSECESPIELGRIEDCLDAVSVDGIRAVALDRVRHEVRRELDHARSGVLATLVVQAHGEPLHRLEQCREHQAHRSCADNVHLHPELSLSEPWSEELPASPGG